MASNRGSERVFEMSTISFQPQAMRADHFQEMVSSGQIHAGYSTDGGTFLSVNGVSWYPVNLTTVNEANEIENEPDDPEEADETGQFDEFDEISESEYSDESEESEESAALREAREYMESQLTSNTEDLMARARMVLETITVGDSQFVVEMAQGDWNIDEDEDEALEASLSTPEAEDCREKGKEDDWEREPETIFWQRNEYSGVKSSLGFR